MQALARLCRERGLRVRDLADALHLSRAVVYDWSTHRRVCPDVRVAEMAKALGCDAEWVRLALDGTYSAWDEPDDPEEPWDMDIPIREIPRRTAWTAERRCLSCARTVAPELDRCPVCAGRPFVYLEAA